MTEVILHVYDVTNSMNVRANSAILNLNKIMRDGIGLGGIFHGAVQIYEEEWSFGFCENGTGVFSCPPKENPMYTYRESVPLGNTELPPSRVDAILKELSEDWEGNKYELLSRNCNHFCEAFCSELGVEKLPLWVNRFANAGDAAFEAAEITMERLKQAKAGVLSASKNAMLFMFGPASPPPPSSDPDSPGNTSRRFSFMGSPSRLLSRGSPSSSQNGNSGHQSRQVGDSSETVIYLPWKGSASELPSTAAQSPQMPTDSLSL